MTNTQATSPPADRYSILIVDDDASILQLLEARLSKAGFQVWTATHGKMVARQLPQPGSGPPCGATSGTDRKEMLTNLAEEVENKADNSDYSEKIQKLANTMRDLASK